VAGSDTSTIGVSASSKIPLDRGRASRCQNGGFLAAVRLRAALRGPSRFSVEGVGADVDAGFGFDGSGRGGSFSGGAGMRVDLEHVKHVVVTVLKCEDDSVNSALV
jgi:hypothetical protein